MSEHNQIMLSPDPGPDPRPRGLIAYLKCLIDRVLRSGKVEQSVDRLSTAGVELVEAKTDQEKARAAEIKAKAITKIRAQDEEKNKRRDEYRLKRAELNNEHIRELARLKVERSKEMAALIKALVECGVELEVAVQLAERVFQAE